MSRITLDEAIAWVESTKLNPQALEVDQLDQIEEEILSRVASVYDTSTWLDPTTTPKIVRVVIAKMYSGWLYDKYYSENQNAPNRYSQMLKRNAETLLEGMVDGSITISGVTAANPSTPAFYPNDASSAMTIEDAGGDTSVGPAKFSIGKSF